MAVELNHKYNGRSVVCLWEAENGRQLLVHTFTGEQVVLDESKRWRLRHNAAGWSFIVADGVSSRWCAQLLKSSMWRSAEGNVYMNVPEGATTSAVWLKQHVSTKK
eukprot:5892438-Amphidinium_carterae.1